MIYKTIIFLCLLLSSCLAIHKHFTPDQSDEFAPFIDNFESHWGHTISTPIFFINKSSLDKINQNALGACVMYAGIIGEIQVVRESWLNMSYDEKEILMFHELGHCELRIFEHDNARINDCPKSIMAETLMNWADIMLCYEPNKEYYLNEIFHRSAE